MTRDALQVSVMKSNRITHITTGERHCRIRLWLMLPFIGRAERWKGWLGILISSSSFRFPFFESEDHPVSFQISISFWSYAALSGSCCWTSSLRQASQRYTAQADSQYPEIWITPNRPFSVFQFAGPNASTMKSDSLHIPSGQLRPLRVAPLRFHSPYSAISQPLITHLLMILHLNAVAHPYTKLKIHYHSFISGNFFSFRSSILIKFLLLFLFRYYRL